MADDAELIGGISVSVGADHSKLASDLAEANRQLDQWAKQKIDVQVGATFTGGTGGGGGGGGRPQAPAAPVVGSSASIASRVSREQGMTPQYLAAVNAALAQEGKAFNVATGEAESLTAEIGKQRTVIAQVQQQAAEPTKLNIDTEALQNDLKEILALLKAVAAEAGSISGAGGGGGGTGRPRRKNIRDRGIGTEARASGIYTYDPEVYAQEDAVREARAAQQRDQLISRRMQADVRGWFKQSPGEKAVLGSLFPSGGGARQTGFPAYISGEEARASREVAPNITSERQRAEHEAEQERRRVATAANVRQRSETERVAAAARDQAFADRFNGPGNGDFFAAGGRGGTGGRGGGPIPTDIEERERQRIATQEAERVSAGRTSRTQASGLGSFFFGGGRERIAAQAALASANERVRASLRNINDAERAGDPRARLSATRDLADAENDRADALKKIESFSGVGAGAKNLLAITAAGTAFGIGLQAVSVAAKAAEKALTPYFDQATGYAQKTADLTTALADQARQQQGNAQGVTALKLAQSGFAATTTASIQPLIAQRAQVEAGNKALVEQVETFRIAENLRRQGSTAGLGGGGTGGVFGTSLFGIPSTGEQAGNFLQGLQQGVTNRQQALVGSSGALFAGHDDPIGRALGLNKGPSQITKDQQELAAAQATQARGLSFLNEQLKLGGNAAAQFTQTLDKTDPRIERTAQAFDSISPEMAKAVRETGLFSNGIKDTTEAISALRALNLAETLTGPAEQLAAQQVAAKNAANSVPAILAEQARQAPGFFASLERKQQIAIGTQLPAQAALANLAAPPTAVGTGIIGRNAKEQAQINASTVETQRLQDTLNAYYDKGYAILKSTYELPLPLFNAIKSIGESIATTQAGIANEQAQYQVAQINYQLFIAKRTLSDIGGLTGHNFGEGKSYLGVLEGQNLALSRQAQLLQFSMSQRQINLQTAVAGFTVPGLTPAEQNARVTEAKKEAEFAQKQLDIQKQMFRNQVKIVDISNLRQGYDLVRQVGLLLQGRRVTIHTAEAQQKLERLQSTQQKLVAEAGTYITKIDAQIAQRESNMQQIEQATGKAITRLETQAVDAAFNVGRALFIGMTGGFLGDGGGGGASASPGGGGKSGGAHRPTHSAGGIFSTKGVTDLGPYGIAGEANRETVAIIRNPHALSGTGGGAGATVNFNGDMVFKTEADFQRMYRMVLAALGKDASIKGLRMPF